MAIRADPTGTASGPTEGMPDGPASAPLGALLARLDKLVDETDREAVAALRARLADERLRVLVVGESQRGKSTLVNALLDADLAPTGVLPVTALPTVIRRGSSLGVRASYADGRQLSGVLDCLPDLVTRDHNPDNRAGLAEVVVTTDIPALAPRVDLVDTPGVGSLFTRSAATATHALDTMDVALFVLSARPPISASEQAFLATVRERAATVVCVLNQMDQLGPAERDTVVDFTTQVLFDALDYRPPLYPLSARDARQAQRRGDERALHASGLPALRAALDRCCDSSHADIRAAALSGHAIRVAASAYERVTLARQTTEHRADRAGRQLAQFSAHLAALDDYRRDAADVARASVERLRGQLTDGAIWDAPRLVATIRTQLHGWLVEQDARADGPALQQENDARAHVSATADRAVDAWHRQWETQVTHGLVDIDTRLTTSLQRHLGTVWQAAHDLLDIDLATPAPAGQLLPNVGTVYSLDDDIGPIPQWSGTLRRHLPGRLGRRAERDYLLDQVDTLVTRQVWRIRDALDRALPAATGALIQAIDARYTQAIAGLSATVAAARDLAGQPDPDTQHHDLAERADELGELINELRAVHARHTGPARSPAAPDGGMD